MNYPKLSDIYDMPTPDLKKLQTLLLADPNRCQSYLQSIQLQIRQRKGIEFFTHICQTDTPSSDKQSNSNKYLIQSTLDIVNTGEINTPLTQPNSSLFKSTHLINNNPTFKRRPQIYDNLPLYRIEEQKYDTSSDEHESQNGSTGQVNKQSIITENIKKIDNCSETTIRSTSKDSKNKEISRSTLKMGIGFHKKKKERVAEIMKKTLARTKVDTIITIKRSSVQSPIKNKYEKKYHVPGQSKEIRKKTTNKNMLPVKQTNVHSNNKQQNVMKLKEAKDIINRTKSETRKSSVKLPKLKQNFDLVAMVKKEEEQKRVRALQRKKNEELRKPSTLPLLKSRRQIKEECLQIQMLKHQNDITEQIIEDIEGSVDLKQGSGQIQDQIIEEIEGIPEQSCEQSVSLSKQSFLGH